MPQLHALPEPDPGVKPRARDAAGGKGELTSGEITGGDPDQCCLLSLTLILHKVKDKLM